MRTYNRKIGDKIVSIRWPNGNHMNALRKQVSANIDSILKGTILAIDPASIRLGYAVAKRGEIVEQGTIELDQKAHIGDRLKDIVNILQNDAEYDVLAIEMIRGQMAHAFLKFSVGAAMGGAKAHTHIEVPINAWKAVAGKGHEKDDASDAAMIAKTIITLALELEGDK